MSYLKVKKYFQSIGLEDRITVHENPADTVDHAAALIGCKPEEIAKSMTFYQEEQPVLIVLAGDVKVNNSKYKETFHQKAVMIPFGEVEERIGHVAGAVCPFAVKEGVTIYLDESLKRFTDIYTAGGSIDSTIHLRLNELEKYSDCRGWVDVGKSVS